MKFKFTYKKKKFELEVKECKSIFSKAFGLMFRKKSLPLLFVFKKPTKQGIHSFFCRSFVVIWFMEGRVVDFRLVDSWKFSIRTKEKFDKFLEIPSGDVVFKRFLDEAKV